MSALASDAQGVVLRCPSCGRKNRIGWSRVGDAGKCGQCETSLGVVARPVEVGDDAAFAAMVAESPVPVLVDFWAAWCGPCHMVAPELEKVAERAAGRLMVAKVNTDDLPALSQAHRIGSIPTMILFRGGREIGRTAGARPAEGILQFVEQHVQEVPGR